MKVLIISASIIILVGLYKIWKIAPKPEKIKCPWVFDGTCNKKCPQFTYCYYEWSEMK